MNILFAVLLGVIQGITEFLPVSSDALILLFMNQTAFDEVPAALMSLALHLGTLLACMWVLRRSFFKLFEAYHGMLRDIGHNLRVFYRNTRFGENGSYARILGNVSSTLAGMVLFATIPAAGVGFLLRHAADNESSAALISGMGFLLTAIILLVASLIPASLKMGRDLTMRKSAFVGLLEGLAVLPGISRCGMVYGTAQLLGMHRKTAARFMFMSALPITILALLYGFTIGTETITFTADMIAPLAVACAVSALAGGRMMRTAGVILRKKSLRLFSVINCIFGVIGVISYVIR